MLLYSKRSILPAISFVESNLHFYYLQTYVDFYSAVSVSQMTTDMFHLSETSWSFPHSRLIAGFV